MESDSSAAFAGPIVFVTYNTNSSSYYGRNGFKLNFAAVETGQALSGNFDDYQFTHYHFRDPVGSISYPQMKGDSQYSPNEIVTFTISTLRNHTVYLDALDLEYDPLCQFDSFTRLFFNSEDRTLERVGPGKSSDNR